MADEVKLTKKQRKAAEFKAAKASGSGVSSSSSSAKAKKGKKRDRDATEDVPEEDLPVEADEQPARSQEIEKPLKVKKTKVNAVAAAVANDIKAGGIGSGSSISDKSKKKDKIKDEASKPSSIVAAPTDSTATKPKTKRPSITDEADATTTKSKGKRKSAEGDESGDVASTSSTPRKFIVFVGNMSFKSTSDQITSHFKSHCSETPSVRLLTTRSSAQDTLSASKRKSIAKGKASDTTIRSKGCAFLEFQTATALQKALGLHHTLFGDRLINVELTAGGGGKGVDRQKKIGEKNAKLEEERKKLHEKYIGPANDEKKRQGEEKRQRGEEVGPPKKKVRKADEGDAQWGKRGGGGGAAAAAASGPPARTAGPKKQPRWMASGANAVRITG